jgi:hypothetical protein
VPVSDAAGVGAILRDVLGPPAPSEPADRNRYGIEGDAPTFGLPARVLDVAIDARVTGDALRAFVDHARTAGATAICVAGTAGSGPTAAERELVERNAPMLAAFTRSAAGIHLQLPDESEAAADPVLYHATVTGEGTITLSPRTGAGAPAIELAQADGSGLRPEPARTDDGRAYLGIGDGTNAGRYVTVASLAANAGLTPVVVTGAIPGDPDQPLAAAPPEGAIGLGMLGRIGADPSSAGVGRAGSPTVRGSLGREVVQRVMRRNITRIRYCYERELATSPSLSGRVETQFVIGPAGAVTTATVEGAGTPDAMRSCIETALRAMQFPQPRGGGIVIVDYPFVFEPA